MRVCTAGCSTQGFVLALYLSFPGTGERTPGSEPGVPGDPRPAPANPSALPGARPGREEGRGEGKQAWSQRGVQSRSLAPRFPGRVCLQSLLLILMFARLVISCSFSQHKKCNCTVPPTRLSSSPAGADSFPVSYLLQHFVFTFLAFPFQPQKQFSATLHSLTANPRGPPVFGS